jgi:RNA polymerase sigma-70 factor (ECF subfamily)
LSASLPKTAFGATRWTLILRARGKTPEAGAALNELCAAYYHPVLRFLCREGRDEDAARDLAQEFFARILTRSAFDEADPERGRFRSYLLGALKHFLADQRKHERRLKRGGGAIPEPLNVTGADDTDALQIADVSPPAQEHIFDREWALAVMTRALAVLETEYSASGKAEQFQSLKPWLMGTDLPVSQADIARRLGLTEGAVKVHIHRLRKRFREAVRVEIAQTLRDPALVDEELRHLILALS